MCMVQHKFWFWTELAFRFVLPSLWQNYLLLWKKTNLTLWLKLAFTSLWCVPKWRFTDFVSRIWNNFLIKITWNKRLGERTRSARPEPPQALRAARGCLCLTCCIQDSGWAAGDGAALGQRGRLGPALGTGIEMGIRIRIRSTITTSTHRDPKAAPPEFPSGTRLKPRPL